MSEYIVLIAAGGGYSPYVMTCHASVDGHCTPMVGRTCSEIVRDTHAQS